MSGKPIRITSICLSVCTCVVLFALLVMSHVDAGASMLCGAKAHQRFLEASRAVALAAHASSGLMVGAAKTHSLLRSRLLEASRLLRAAQGLARMATALLEYAAGLIDVKIANTAEVIQVRRLQLEEWKVVRVAGASQTKP